MFYFCVVVSQFSLYLEKIHTNLVNMLIYFVVSYKLCPNSVQVLNKNNSQENLQI